MKKRLIAIILAAACALSAALTGCSSASTSGTDASTAGSGASSTGTNGNSSSEGNTVVAGFVYIGKITDGGYTQAHDAGRLAVEKMGVETHYLEDVPETVADTKNAIQTLIDEGCNLIYTNSFGFM